MQLRVVSWFALVVAATSVAIALVGSPVPVGWLAPAAARAPLRVGYALEAPYAHRDDRGQLDGEAVEVLRALLARLDLPEPVWIHVEHHRLIHELRAGRIDIAAAGLFVTPDAAAQVDFTAPTASVRTGLLVARGNPLGLHALAQLRQHPGARLAVIDGSHELVQARQAGLAPDHLMCVVDLDGALAALRDGRAVALALPAPRLDRLHADPTIAATWEIAAPFTTPAGPGGPDIGYPALALRPGDPLRDRLDDALAGYLGSPEHLAVARRHGFSPEDIAAAHGFHGRDRGTADPTER